MWDLHDDAGMRDVLPRWNAEFYDATMAGFAAMREEIRQLKRQRKGAKKGGEEGEMTATELNHEFFNYQMSRVDAVDGSGGLFATLPLYKRLLHMTRAAAALVLERHGLSKQEARSKAWSHNCLIWASVHTAESVHEPHNTEDSLLGGVYYVSAPTGSGELTLLDPRGKPPVRGGGATDPPQPPFHRTVGIQPAEGLLLLFPGWLVHDVQPSTGLDVRKQRHRVSISVNLKGEWQDTSSLMLSSTRPVALEAEGAGGTGGTGGTGGGHTSALGKDRCVND